jgi:hypothetical protein
VGDAAATRIAQTTTKELTMSKKILMLVGDFVEGAKIEL